jgi:hypothetical protein
METGNHFKNGASLKNLMSKGMLVLLSLTVLFLPSCTEEIEIETSAYSLAVTASFNSEGGTEDVDATCSVALTVASCPDWITVTKTGETGVQIFHLTISENESSNTRAGFVKLGAIEKKGVAVAAIISVIQTGK